MRMLLQILIKQEMCVELEVYFIIINIVETSIKCSGLELNASKNWEDSRVSPNINNNNSCYIIIHRLIQKEILL